MPISTTAANAGIPYFSGIKVKYAFVPAQRKGVVRNEIRAQRGSSVKTKSQHTAQTHIGPTDYEQRQRKGQILRRQENVAGRRTGGAHGCVFGGSNMSRKTIDFVEKAAKMNTVFEIDESRTPRLFS